MLKRGRDFAMISREFKKKKIDSACAGKVDTKVAPMRRKERERTVLSRARERKIFSQPHL